jgi:peptidoglycan DL-endopeptidase CwlO
MLATVNRETLPALRPASSGGVVRVGGTDSSNGASMAGAPAVSGAGSMAGTGGDPGSATDRVNPSIPYADTFNEVGERYGISPRLLAAVGKVESSYRPDAVSSAGAIGLMQLMPATAAGLGVDPWDPIASIDAAARLLVGQRDRFGSIELALAAYNVGPGTISRAGGILPGSQAEKYVNAVLRTMETST